jgi:hypothetical protein
MSWNLYQVNTKAKAYTYTLIHEQMSYGDTFVAHLQAGLCFILLRRQGPVPPSNAVLSSVALEGDSSTGGGATSNNGTKMGCATPQNINDPSLPYGDVTIEVH